MSVSQGSWGSRQGPGPWELNLRRRGARLILRVLTKTGRSGEAKTSPWGALPGGAAGDLPRPNVHRRAMEQERPPDVDADYRLVHGPWPRWALQLGLVKLALRTAAVVAVFIAIAL